MKVSISYAHTSDEHQAKVLLFAEKLAQNGIEFTIDYYDLELGNDLLFFMEKLTLSEENDYVIVICNQNYKEKADSYKGGVGFEARNLRYLSQDPKQTKVIPVIFEHDKEGRAIRPNFLLTCIYKDLTDDNDFTSKDFKELVDFLKGVKRIKPDIVPIPEFGFTKATNEDQLSKYHNIVFPRKNNLVNRNSVVVSKIADYFDDKKFVDSSIVKPVLLKSWSGEGKTTIAIEFAYKYGLQFIASFWIDCSKSINDQFIYLSQYCLNIQVDGYKDEERKRQLQIDSTKDYINKHNVLIIFDNIEKLSKIDSFLPQTGGSRVIAITTNFNIKSGDFFNEIDIPKLSDNESIQILSQNIELNNKENLQAIKIANLLGNLPFALELANSYLQEYSDVSLTAFYDEIEESTIKWEGLVKTNEFNFIHKSTSVISLIEKRIMQLDEGDKIDRLCKNTLSLIGYLDISMDEFDYPEIKHYLNLSSDNKENALGILYKLILLYKEFLEISFEVFDYEEIKCYLDSTLNTKDNLKIFNKIKNRLSILGLVVCEKNKFTVHTLTLYYLKTFLANESILNKTIESKIKLLSLHKKFEETSGMFLANEYLEPLRKLIFYYYENFKSINKEKINKLITHLMSLFELYYFYSMDKEALNCINKVLKLEEIDGDFTQSQISFNEINYHKGVVLHRMGEYNKAMEIYQKYLSPGIRPLVFQNILNCFIYTGHIYRYYNDYTKAISTYKSGLLNAVSYFKEKFISEVEYLVFNIKMYYFLSFCYIRENRLLDLAEINKKLDEYNLHLMKFVPENRRVSNQNDPRFYFYEIKEILEEPDSTKPLYVKLNALGIKIEE